MKIKLILVLLLIAFIALIISCKSERTPIEEPIYENVEMFKKLDTIDFATLKGTKIHLRVDIPYKVIDVSFLDNKVVFTTDTVKDNENHWNVTYKYVQSFLNAGNLQKVESFPSSEGILLKTKPKRNTIYLGLYVVKKDDPRKGITVRVEHCMYDDTKPARVIIRDDQNPAYPFNKIVRDSIP